MGNLFFQGTVSLSGRPTTNESLRKGGDLTASDGIVSPLSSLPKSFLFGTRGVRDEGVTAIADFFADMHASLALGADFLVARRRVDVFRRSLGSLSLEAFHPLFVSGSRGALRLNTGLRVTDIATHGTLRSLSLLIERNRFCSECGHRPLLEGLGLAKLHQQWSRLKRDLTE